MFYVILVRKKGDFGIVCEAVTGKAGESSNLGTRLIANIFCIHHSLALNERLGKHFNARVSLANLDLPPTHRAENGSFLSYVIHCRHYSPTLMQVVNRQYQSADFSQTFKLNIFRIKNDQAMWLASIYVSEFGISYNDQEVYLARPFSNLWLFQNPSSKALHNSPFAVDVAILQ